MTHGNSLMIFFNNKINTHSLQNTQTVQKWEVQSPSQDQAYSQRLT